MCSFPTRTTPVSSGCDVLDRRFTDSSIPDPTELSHFTPLFQNHTHLLPGTACYTAPNFDVGKDITFMLTYQVCSLTHSTQSDTY
jgi:hypothetical protein